jgi:hypothetical protein
MRRFVLSALLCAFVAACTSPDGDPTETETETTTDAGEPEEGAFAFHLNGCRAHPADLVATRVEIVDDSSEDHLIYTTNDPEDDLPWCDPITPASFDATDAQAGASGTAHFDLKIEGRKVTIEGSAEASGATAVATAKSGFELVDVRAGGGGVEQVRVTVVCSGSVAGSGVAGLSVSKADGEEICSTSAAGGMVFPFSQTSAVIEETTTGPDDPVASLRIGFEALGGGGEASSASSSGKIEITVEPL